MAVACKTTKVILCGAIAVFFCLFSSFAYAGTSIWGKVTDKATNSPIASASVKVSTISDITISSTSTDSGGNYLITKNFVTGSYIIRVSATGYKSYILAKIIWEGHTHILDFALEPTAKNNPPQITSFSPNNNTRSILPFFAGDTINISVSATDPDNNTLYYRYSLDNKIIQTWTTSRSYNFKPTSQDKGQHKLKIEATDNKGGLDSRSVDIFILIALPKPPE